MLLEKRVVSRKTPLDGKLEVSEATALRIADLGPTFSLSSPGGEATGSVEAFECTCGKRPGGRHIHHFVASPLLKGLAEGAEVRVELDEGGGQVTIVPTTTGTDA